jgi:hypothetical protein
MPRFRLGRTGSGLFRLHVGGGRHASGSEPARHAYRPDAHDAYLDHPTYPEQPAYVPAAVPAPVFSPPSIPAPILEPIHAPILEPIPAQVAPAGPVLDPRVGLVLRDGRELRLEAADPRARIFLTVASELLRPLADLPTTRSG